MNDHHAALREGLAAIIDPSGVTDDDYVYERVDAALRYLTEAGVMIPPIPEWATEFHIYGPTRFRNGNDWHASIADPASDGYFDGRGPTFAASLSDAIREAE